MCILLVIFLTAGISVTYYILTRQDKQRESQERIQIAFDIMLDDFVSREDLYTEVIEKFVQDNFHLSMTAHFYNQDASQIQSMEFIAAYFFALVDELKKFGQAISVDRLLFYGIDKRLLIAYHHQANQEDVGVYRKTQAGEDVYLSLNDPIVRSRFINATESIPDTQLPPHIAASWNNQRQPLTGDRKTSHQKDVDSRVYDCRLIP